MIELEVQIVHLVKGIAILSDGQEVPITDFIGGSCKEEAVTFVAGPDYDGNWYVFSKDSLERVIIN